MAVTAITPKVLKRNTVDVDSLVMTAPTAAADGFLVDVSNCADHRILLAFQNTDVGAQTFTVKKGNGLQGVADLASGSIAASKFATVVVESGAFKNISGTNKGKILIIPSVAGVKMAAVVLP